MKALHRSLREEAVDARLDALEAQMREVLSDGPRAVLGSQRQRGSLVGCSTNGHHGSSNTLRAEDGSRSVEKICALVAEAHCISLDELLGASRNIRHTWPRHIARYFAARVERQCDVARFFCCIPNTVSNSVTMVVDRCLAEPEFRKGIIHIESAILALGLPVLSNNQSQIFNTIP